MDMRKLGLTEHMFNPLWHHFQGLIIKKCGFAVPHLIVTLRMMSDNSGSISSIGPEHVRLIFQLVRHSLYEQLECNINSCQITNRKNVFVHNIPLPWSVLPNLFNGFSWLCPAWQRQSYPWGIIALYTTFQRAMCPTLTSRHSYPFH
jgi:hypothetical protein